MTLFRKQIIYSLIIFAALISSCSSSSFDEERAFQYAVAQVAFGPRIPGSTSLKYTQEFITEVISNNGWFVEQQEFIHLDTVITNIIAKNSTEPPAIIIGTHYDTRALSDRDSDPNLQNTPVPGANDGASGTAVLLELSHHILRNGQSIWLVFFDAEDQGRLGDWDWSIGAKYFAESLTHNPREVVIIDMVGDTDLNIHYEANSSSDISENIWTIAHQLGYSNSFIKEQKYSIIDDHLPFIEMGIPSALIIDLDYPFWHTTQDNLDHISADSLNIVGQVLIEYLN